MNIFLHIMYAGNTNLKKNEKACKTILKHHPNCDGFISSSISQNMVFSWSDSSTRIVDIKYISW